MSNLCAVRPIVRQTHRPFRGLARGAFATGIFLACVQLPALAEETSAARTKPGEVNARQLSSSDVNESTGTFSASIPIRVPAFRGLEPKLALTYNSTGGNGFAGVGWVLSGTSIIERTGPKGGAPRYNGSDAFTLDGEELVGCGAMGGTHCTRHQNYQRITYSASANGGKGSWEIRSKDGTKSTYNSFYGLGTSTFRWALASRQDTNGNTVNYAYSCSGVEFGVDTNCYLNTISYNGAVITLYRENRPDVLSFTTGYGVILNYQRLRAIGVRVGTKTWAYQLNYKAANPGTERSVLESFQEFGTDAVISASGTVTGSSLPRVTMATQGAAVTFAKGPSDGNGNVNGLGNLWNADEVNILFGDFNGDGKQDILRQEKRLADSIPGNANSSPHYNILTYLGNGDGTFTAGPFDTTSYNAKGLADTLDAGYYWSGIWARVILGDYNGDGRTDILRQELDVLGNGDIKSNILVYLANADGSFTRQATDVNDNACGLGHDWGDYGATVHVADFNGDGKMDILRQERAGKATDGAGDPYNMMIFLSQGNGCFNWDASKHDAQYNAIGLGPAWSGSNVDIHIADFTGDGIPDILRQEKAAYASSDSYRMIELYIGNGDGTFYRGPTEGTENAVGLGSDWNGDTTNVHLGDFNNDGKTDILRQEKTDDGVGTIEIYYSIGNGTFKRGTIDAGGGVPGLGPKGEWRGDLVNIQVADFNGDGLADILRQEKAYWGAVDAINQVRVYLARGDASFYLQPVDGNFNGSGLGADWNAEVWSGNPGNCCANVLLADFNNDGKTDIMRQEHANWATDAARMLEIYLQPYGAPDLLTTLGNGLGGSTSVSYVPSSASYYRTYLPVGYNTQLASSVTVSDGRGVSDTTYFSYYYGKWSDTLRQSMGFGLAQARPSDGSYINTSHVQTEANPGRISQVDTYSAEVKLLHSTATSYTASGGPPYASLVSRVDVSEHNGYTSNGVNGTLGAYRTTRKEFSYDAYANVTYLYDYGDIAVSGDERTIVTPVIPNTTAYLVEDAAYINTFRGITTDPSALLSSIIHYYDNAAAYTTPPTKGNKTKFTVWNNVTGAAHATTALFDAYGNINSVTDPLNRTTTTTFDSTGPFPNVFASRTCNALIQCVDKTWDHALGQIVDVKDANGAFIRTGFDAFGRMVSQSDAGLNAPGPNVTTWTYNGVGSASGQYVQKIQPDGSTTPDGYGIVGLWQNTLIDGLGRIYKMQSKGLATGAYIEQDTVYSDASALPARVTQPYIAGTANPPASTFLYDALDRTVRTTHADGSFVTAEFGNDSLGKPFVKTTREMGQETTTWDDAHDRVVTIREKNGGEYYYTTMTWDMLGNKLSTTDNVGNVQSATYDSLSRKLTETDPNRGTMTYTYDAGGQLQTTFDAKGQLISLTYDALGRMKTRLSGGQTTTYFYDEAAAGFYNIGHGTRVTYPGGNKSQSWDLLGRLASSTHCIDTLCRTTRTTYDAGGRQKTVTYPDNEVVTYGYDAAGRMATVTGARNYVTSMLWTPSRQLLSMSYGNGSTNEYTYDTNRRWLLSAEAKTPGPTPATLFKATYGYDTSARVTTTTQSTTTVKASDALVTYVSSTTATKPGIYALSVSGFAAASAITGNNTAGLLITSGSNDTVVVQLGSSTASVVLPAGLFDTARLAYYLQERINTHPTFVAAAMGVNVTYFSGRLKVTSTVVGSPGRVDFTGGNGKNNLGFLTYTREGGWDMSGTINGASAVGLGNTLKGAVGNVAEGLLVSVNGGATGSRGTISFKQTIINYGYDDLNRLLTVTGGQTQTFTYDSIGNIASNSLLGTYTYHPTKKHAVTQAGTKAYTYDPNGNMLSGQNNAHTMTWDSENRMATFTKGGVVTSFGYAEGTQRVKKTTGGIANYYFSPLVEHINDFEDQYYYAEKVLVAHKKVTATSTATRWYHADRLGSIRVLSRETGTAVNEYDYQAFGATESETGTGTNERGFTGHITDDMSGLIYMNARYYDPELARFVSADSVVSDPDNPQDYNRYTYALNNPISNTDPTGHGALDVLEDIAEFFGDLLGVTAITDFIQDRSWINAIEALGSIASIVPVGRIGSLAVRTIARAAKRSGKSLAPGVSTVARRLGKAIAQAFNDVSNSAVQRRKLERSGKKFNYRSKAILASRAAENRAENLMEKADGYFKSAAAMKKANVYVDKDGRTREWYLGHAAQLYLSAYIYSQAAAAILGTVNAVTGKGKDTIVTATGKNAVDAARAAQMCNRAVHGHRNAGGGGRVEAAVYAICHSVLRGSH